jgi:RHS repeat-associated protein
MGMIGSGCSTGEMARGWTPASARFVRILASSLILTGLILGASGLVPAAAPAEPLCTDTWTGPNGGTWQTAANWSAGHAPTATDVACISSEKTVRVTAGTNQAGVLEDQGGLAIAGATLELVNALEPSSTNSLTFESGTLQGAATLNVIATFTWSNGTMSGSGKTVLGTGVTGHIENELLITERTLINEGNITFGAGELSMANGAKLQNQGTFQANAEGRPGIENIKVASGSTTPPLIVNTGLFTKSASEAFGTHTTNVAVPVENHGKVASTGSGALYFTDGGSANATSESTATEGSSVVFDGGAFTLSGGKWSGTIQIRGGTVTEEGLDGHAATVVLPGGSLVMPTGVTTVSGLLMEGSGGTLTGAGTIDVTSSFTWTGGTMSGSGATVVGPAVSGRMGNGSKLEQRTLTNEGSDTVEGATWLMSNGAHFFNAGTTIVNTEGPPENAAIDVAPESTSPPLIVNTGTFEKTSSEAFGTGTTIVAAPFENLGVAGDKVPYSGTRLTFTHPVVAEPSTQYGGEGPSAGHPNSRCGRSVGCATGNESTSQTDLAVGGRGVGLNLTRTYNAQAAAGGTHGAFGYGWTSSFSDHLVVEKTAKLATLYQANGSTVAFVEGSGGSFTPPAWTQDSLSGTAEAGYTVILADQLQYKFAGPSGRLESVTDRNGNATTLSYTEAGRLEAITDPAGRKLTLAYNAEGLVESAKDPMGHVVKYTYEASNLATVTLPGETAPNWQFKYDPSREMTLETDARGNKTTREYNGAHQVISETDPMERKLSFEYEAFHTRITNAATGAVTDEFFTSQDEPSSVTRGYGTASATTESLSYDGAGNVASVTDGNGHTTKYTYDAASNRTSMLDANKNETKWGYNSTHDVTSTTTPKGETTTIKRDVHGNAEVIERPAPGAKTQITKYKYDLHGDLESVEDPLKRVWKYEYNTAGDRTAATDPEGDKRTWTYDEDSLETAAVSPRGSKEPLKFTTKVERDARERPIKLTNPLGDETKYTYDPVGNIETTTDALGHATTYTYDADNEQIKIKAPAGTVTETGYDGAGRVISQTDGNKRTTKYGRNALGEVTEVADALGRKTTKEYDAAGNLKTLTDAAKRTATYAYDSANRLTEVSYSDGKTPTVKSEYDADGDRTKMTDGTGTATYGYDQLDRLTESKDGHGDVSSYEYDLANQQTKITYPNGKAVAQGYDKAGRLEKVTDWLEHTTIFSYDADSDQTATKFPTGTGEEDKYTLNAADVLTKTQMKKGTEVQASLTYARDKDGQLKTTTTVGLPGEEKIVNTYDSNNRLTKAGTVAYEYDPANNPTKTGASTNTYNEADQLEKGTGTTYSYDELGERTKLSPSTGPATTYGYDQAGNLTTVTRPKEGETAAIEDTYGYDVSGLRSSQTISGSTSYLVWDVANSTPLILDDGGSSYLYGPGGVPIAQINAGTGAVTYLHHDQAGSTRLITGATGAVEASYTFDAYGNQAGHTGTASTPLGYDGQYTSGDSGLIYLRARSYDPATAQFLSADPAEAITQAPYGYARENPSTFGDPSGLWSPTETLEEVTSAVGHVFVGGVRGTLDVLAVGPYAVYTGSYELARGINYLGEQFGLPGEVVSHLAALPLAKLEALGLAGDVGIDALKNLILGNESICDEGKVGYINPLHGFAPGPLKGPAIYLPGVHETGQVDFEW